MRPLFIPSFTRTPLLDLLFLVCCLKITPPINCFWTLDLIPIRLINITGLYNIEETPLFWKFLSFFDIFALWVCFHGTREGVDERDFLPEASRTARSLPDSYQRLTMGSHKGYSRTQFQSLTDSAEQQEQRCFVLGSEIKAEKKDEIQKPLHQFFGEWPPKNTDSWLDLASNSRVPTG